MSEHADMAPGTMKRGLGIDEAPTNGRVKRIRSEDPNLVLGKAPNGSTDGGDAPRSSKKNKADGAATPTRAAGTIGLNGNKGKGSSRKKPAPKKSRAAASSLDVPPLETWTYTPGDLLPELINHIGRQLTVLVPARHLTTHNERVTGCQIWGSDIYTDDSDVVCVLAHTDKFTLQDTPPPHDLLVTLRILAAADRYAASNRKHIRSRTWAEAHDGCSIKVEKVEKVKAKKPDDPREKERARERLLKQRMKQKSSAQERNRANRRERLSANELLAPSIVFSLSNDPCLKYSQPLVADRGVQPEAYTAFRFKEEVLFLETDTERFELALYRSTDQDDLFKWAKVLHPHYLSVKQLAAIGTPLPDERVEVIHKDLRWTDIWWSNDSVMVRHDKYLLQRAFWWPVSRLQPAVSAVVEGERQAVSALA